MARVTSMMARVAGLEAKLGPPPKTWDDSSVPPSKGQRPSYSSVWKDKAKRYAAAHGPRLYAIDTDDTVFAPGFKGLLNRACEMDRRRDDVADSTLKVYDADLSRQLNRPMGLTPTRATGHQLQAIIKNVLQHLSAFAAKRATSSPPTTARSELCAPASSIARSPTAFAWNGVPRFTPISDPSWKSDGEDQCEPSTPSTSPSKIVRPLRRLQTQIGT